MAKLEIGPDHVGIYRIPWYEHWHLLLRKMGNHWSVLSREMTLFMRITLTADGE